jgi:uncharacterized damage-inducible protein DinB
MNRPNYIQNDVSNSAAIDVLIGAAIDARATTLARIQDISEEVLHWQFSKEWNSISCLLEHILCLKDLIKICCIDRRPMTPLEEEVIIPAATMGEYIPELIGKRNLEEYKELLTKNLEEMIEYLKEIEVSNLWTIYETNNNKNNTLWWLYHIIEDEVNHRGQISLLVKLYNFQKNNKQD